MAFYVGQKVVCVDDSPARSGSLRRVILNAIYTVDGIDPETKTGIYLLEIPNDPIPPGVAWKFPIGWSRDRFRPLTEKKTDTGMAMLREILDRETVNDKPPVRQPAIR